MSTAAESLPPSLPQLCGDSQGYWTCVMAPHHDSGHYYQHLQ